jgi:predicted permease
MKWVSSLKRRRWEERMATEFQFHLDSRISDYVRQGLSRQDAELRARLEFGPVDLAKDQCRDLRPLEALNHLLRDVRHAFWSLSKSPGLAMAATLTLALGIGANTAMFSVLDGVILAPLPYREPDRLVLIALYNRTLKYPTDLSYPDFLDWQRGARSFQQIAAYMRQSFDLTSSGAPQHVDGNEVSSGFFSTLGVKLALGREFSTEEDGTGGPPAAVISNRLWRERFAASPAALGKLLTLSGVDYTIVGVLRPGFRFGNEEADVYAPIGRGDPLFRNDRTVHNILSIARLKPEVSIGQAQAEMNTVQEHIDQLNPTTERGLATFIIPLKQFFVGDVRGTLWLLLGAVGLVLLIACANVANLLLVRSAARTREFAVRLALGASRMHIVRQLVTESVLLSLTGGALGIAGAKWGLRAVLAASSGSLPRVDNIGVNVSVLIFTLGVSTLVGILFGLLPALRSSNTNLEAGLKEGSRGSAAGHYRTQRLLVVMQNALVLVLLMGGSLLYRTIHNLWSVSPGYDTRHVFSFQVGLSPSVITSAKVRIAYQHLVDRTRQIPGVQAADITALLPLSQQDNSGPFWIGAHQPASMAEIPRAVYYATGPDYPRTMEIPLLRGRFLSPADHVNSELVVLIDSLLARIYFPHGDAVGHTITIPHWGAARNVAARIVGVVGHVEQSGLDGSANEKPQIYYSFYQLPDDAVPVFRRVVTLTVRTLVDPATVMPAIKNAVYEEGSDEPIYNIRTMRDLVSLSMGRQRLPMILLSAFAGLALLLACVGIYGVISYSMAQRVRELGIRVALGAANSDVLRLVMGQCLRLVLAGVATGAAAAFILAHALANFSRLLYGVHPDDPLTFLGASFVLLSSALLACYIPARRAARLDPVIALRHE